MGSQAIAREDFMMKAKRDVWFPGAVMGAALFLATGASPASAAGFGAVLTGPGGGPFCGPCEPTPVLTRATPDSAVLALRYRWASAAGRFELVGKDEVGVTDHQGELRFALRQGPGSVDKVVVLVGGAVSNAFVFESADGCGGPQLCPLPRRFHAFVAFSSYLPGQAVIGTVSGADRGRVLAFAQESYLQEGDTGVWIPTGKPVFAEVDAVGQATVLFQAGDPGVYRVIARDPETGEESGTALFEVGGGLRR
jgi:hypothetical protein